MEQNPTQQCEQLWRDFVRAQNAVESTQFALLTRRRSSLLSCLRDALTRPGERIHAIHLLRIMPEEDRKAMMPELFALGTWQNQVTEQAKELIFSVPQDWLQDNIFNLVEPLIHGTDCQEVWGVLDICNRIDQPKAVELAHRISAHANPDFREAGKTFLEKLRRSDTSL